MSEETKNMLLLLSIPLSGGFVGWFTNWLALVMTFKPLEYWGVRPFGWQGIIPSKAGRMAEIAVDMITTKLLFINERFDQIDPKVVAKEMLPSLTELSRRLINEVMETQAPNIWKNTPDMIKTRIYQSVSEDLPAVVEQMLEDIKTNLPELLDVKKIAVRTLTRNKELLNKMFQKCGEKEFKFIEVSGLYFGFLLGLPQMVVSYFYNPWWFLPLFGLIVGYLTNDLALRLIFEPLYPKKILGLFTFQGLFIKRQNEVSEVYCKMVNNEILTTESMFEYVMRGPGSAKMAQLLETQVHQIIEKAIGNSKLMVETVVGKRLEAIKNIASYRIIQEMPISVRSIFDYTEKSLDLENELLRKMKALSPKEFEGFLRPVFQEDEMKLILIGAFLGLLAGFAQYYFLF